MKVALSEVVDSEMLSLDPDRGPHVCESGVKETFGFAGRKHDSTWGLSGWWHLLVWVNGNSYMCKGFKGIQRPVHYSRFDPIHPAGDDMSERWITWFEPHLTR